MATGVGPMEQSMYSRKRVEGSKQVTTFFLSSLLQLQRFLRRFFIIAIKTNIYHNRFYRRFLLHIISMLLSQIYPTPVCQLLWSVMMGDHACIFLFRLSLLASKCVMLPQARGQQKPMAQRCDFTPMHFWAVVRVCTGADSVSQPTLSRDFLDFVCIRCARSAIPQQFLQPF